jgi:hypothetical protein
MGLASHPQMSPPGAVVVTRRGFAGGERCERGHVFIVCERDWPRAGRGAGPRLREFSSWHRDVVGAGKAQRWPCAFSRLEHIVSLGSARRAYVSDCLLRIGA